MARPDACLQVGEPVEFDRLFAVTPTPYVVLSLDLEIVEANLAFQRMTGRSRAELIGRHVRDWQRNTVPGSDFCEDLEASLRRVCDTGETETLPGPRHDLFDLDSKTFEERDWSVTATPVLRDGRPVWLLLRAQDVSEYIHDRVLRASHGSGANSVNGANGANAPRMLSEAESDLIAQSQELARVNRELRDAHDRLAELALRDPLTGLLGRAGFLESVSNALARLKRRSHLVAVLFVDLDRLKFVNDTYGHAVGDELLRCCADQLQHSVRPSDIVARIGGDEFVVLLDELAEEREADMMADRILTAPSRPCTLHPVSGPRVAVPPTASIGIAVADRADIGGEALISRADAAMYRAKGDGRGRCVRYDEMAFAALGQRTQTAAELRVAVTDGQLRLHYQPIIDVTSGRASAVEALLRWQHPQRGLLSAGEFLDVAEDNSLIIELGHWVLRESCRQLAEWDARLGDEAPESMFINLSTAEFSRPELRSVLVETVGNTGVDPGRLVLEITETGLLAEPAVTGEATKNVTELGCSLAIDDFGTGYSSLSRLTTLPARILKIDQSSVRGLTDNAESLAVVSAVLLLAHNLRKTVVAEGVESAEVYEVLRELGCHYAQ